jgi:hypothetical protein
MVTVALIRGEMYTYRNTDLTARRSRAVTARSSWNRVSRVVAVALIRREMWSETPRQMIMTRSLLAMVIRVISSR